MIFIEAGVKVSSHVYVHLLEEHALPWIAQSFRDGYVVVQDVASSHTANFTQQWCKTHMPGFWDKDMWPPSSPGLSPMDFTTWAILEREMCVTPHSSMADLKLALETAWSDFDEGTVRRSRLSAGGGFGAGVKTKGGHIGS